MKNIKKVILLSMLVSILSPSFGYIIINRFNGGKNGFATVTENQTTDPVSGLVLYRLTCLDEGSNICRFVIYTPSIAFTSQRISELEQIVASNIQSGLLSGTIILPDAVVTFVINGLSTEIKIYTLTEAQTAGLIP